MNIMSEIIILYFYYVKIFTQLESKQIDRE